MNFLREKVKEKYVVFIIIDYKNQLERTDKLLKQIKQHKKKYKYDLWRYSSQIGPITHKKQYLTESLCIIDEKNDYIITELVYWDGFVDIW